jgi:hypothetical protein
MAYLSTIENDFAPAAHLQTVTFASALCATRSAFLLPIFLEDSIVGSQEVCHGVRQNTERRTLFQSYANASIHEIVLLCVRDNKGGTLLALLG